jgi:hypothetical protein
MEVRFVSLIIIDYMRSATKLYRLKEVFGRSIRFFSSTTGDGKSVTPSHKFPFPILSPTHYEEVRIHFEKKI